MSLELPQAYAKGLELCAHPVFVIGSPRSGTSILARSLSEHPQFWSSDESQFLWDLFYDDRVATHYERGESSWLRRQGIDREDFLAHLGLGINVLLTRQSSGKRWVDHTPIYTLIVDRVATMFPGAYFLHIRRDGRHVVHSMLNYLNIYEGDPSAIPWARDFRAACRTWRNHVQRATDFERRQPARCKTVAYERLVADPADEFREILRFLEASYDDRPARFFATTRLNSSFQGRSLAGCNQRPDPSEQWSEEERSIYEEEAVSVEPRPASEDTPTPTAAIAVVGKPGEAGRRCE